MSQQGHVWSLCFGVLGIVAGWRLVVQLAGERAGFLAVLFLVSMPRYYGHMFFNPKDIPFAATYLLSIWALVRMLKCLPDFPSWKAVTVFGGCAGLAISSRIGGLLVLFYFAVSVFVFLALKYSRSYWKSGESTSRPYSTI